MAKIENISDEISDSTIYSYGDGILMYMPRYATKLEYKYVTVINGAVDPDIVDAVDANATVERQKYDLDKLIKILGSDFDLSDKDEARTYFNQLRQKFIDWNYVEENSDAFRKIESEIDGLYSSKNGKVSQVVEKLLKDGE